MYKPVFNPRNVLKFTHFTRKGYALFACLGRVVIIGVLSVATLETATATSLSDETDKVTTDSTLSSRQVMLDEVSVTGTRAPLTQRQQARMVTVLSREDVQAAPVQSVNDLLKYAAGIDVRQRGALGAQTDVSIRGSNYEQITILLNGINICDPQTGHNSFDLPVDISDIERIEILEGPAGRAYGTSSLLGAVNIVTRRPSPALPVEGGGKSLTTNSLTTNSLTPAPSIPSRARPTVGFPKGEGSNYGIAGELHAEGGSYGYMSVGGRIGWQMNKVKQKNVSTPLSRWEGYGGASSARDGGVGGESFHSLSASYTRSDGFSRNKAGGLNADYNCAKAFYEGGYGTESVRVRWHAGLSAKNFGSNTFYGVKSDDQFEHTFKSFTAVQAEAQAGRFHLRPALYWNHHYDRFEYFRSRSDAIPFNYHRTDVYGLNLNSYFDWAGGRTALGMEMRNEDLVSGNLGEPLDHPKHIHGTDRDYLYGLNRTNISLHLEHNILLQRFTLSAGLVAVKNSWADMGVRVYPGIDMAYRIGNDWKVFASYNTSLRMPSATELYYSVEGYKADKHLKPEELTAIEGGVKVQNYGMTAQVSIFYNHHKNLIDWIRNTDKGADAPWESVNFGSIDAVGIETSAQLNLLRLLPHQSLLQRLSLSYCYISQRQQEKEGIQSKYALEYLRHKLVARLQTKIWKQLFFDMSWRLQERMGSYTATNGTVEHYGGYGIVDCRLVWKGRMLEVHGDVNNLFGRRYVDYGNVPQAGTWVVAGVKVRM